LANDIKVYTNCSLYVPLLIKNYKDLHLLGKEWAVYTNIKRLFPAN